jgi:hypothetical protein
VQELWEVIESCAAPGMYPKQLDFLRRQDGWVRIDMEPAEFVAALEQDYSVRMMVTLHLREVVGGEIRLSSWLEGAGCLFAKIDDEGSIRFSRRDNMLFPLGCTALDYALERVPPDANESQASLFIVDSRDSVEILQRLGLPAVTSDGLESLEAADIQKMFDGDPRSDYGWRHFLVLLDFDVANFTNQPTAAMGAVIERFADTADVYRIDPGRRVALCRLSADEFHRLERAAKLKDAEQVRQIIEDCATAARGLKIDCWRSFLSAKAPSLSEARAALIRALGRPDDPLRRSTVRDALAEYLAAVKRTVTDRLWTDIDHAGDPIEQLKGMEAAYYADVFLANDPLIRLAEAVLAGRDLPSARELQDDAFEKLQKCMAGFRRIYRERKPRR